jgi:peptide-methionine (R)-S-oxide reductase
MNEEELKNKLTPEQYAVLREKATEAPFTGKYVHEKKSGMYKCAACGQELFSSDTKFDSGTGWPSFDDAIPGSVEFVSDDSHGMHRTEVVCSKCKSHLGHMFEDGPSETTGKRYCINSVCLDLEEK